MKVQDLTQNKGVLALREMGRISAEKGNAEMSLEKINAEIAEARKSGDDNKNEGAV